MTISCDNCRFWQKFSLSDDGPFLKVTPGTGQCRYHPPVLDQKTYEYDRSDDAADCARWPITWGDHWCGQHPGNRVQDSPIDALRFAIDASGLNR